MRWLHRTLADPPSRSVTTSTSLVTAASALLATGCPAAKSPAPHDPPPAVEEELAPEATATETGATEDAASADALVGLGAAIDAFGVDLWGQVRKERGNLTISPASIHVALTMTWAGAVGDTREQMGKVLHLEQLSPDLAPAAATGRLLRDWNDSEAITLRAANRLFGHSDYRFEASYLALVEGDFGAPLQRLNFLEPEPARQEINTWVEAHTENRIKDLIPPRGVDGNTRLVLVNAVYFLADWNEAFDPAQTAPGTFQARSGAVEVPMMSAKRPMKYFEDDKVQVVKLPYVGGRYSMTLVLPRSGPLDAVEGDLSAGSMAAWFARVDSMPRELRLKMPRFELAPPSSMNLKDPLRALGMKLAFQGEKADFTGMANPPDPSDRLSISEVFHKTFVKVDERGTEAAAATAVAMGRGAGMPAPVPEMTLDRPFLFFIRDDHADATLFMGRVADPS